MTAKTWYARAQSTGLGAVRFTASDKAVASIADASQTGLDPLTSDMAVWGWVQPASVTGTQWIFSKGGGGAVGYGLYRSTTSLRFSFQAAATDRVITLGTIAANTWYFFAVIIDRSGNATGYLNAVAGTPVDVSADVAVSIDNATAFTMGADPTPANWFGGRLAAVGVGFPADASAIALADVEQLYTQTFYFDDLTADQKTKWGLITDRGGFWDCDEAAVNATSPIIDQHSTNDLAFSSAELLSNTGFETRTGITGASFAATDKAHLQLADNAACDLGTGDFVLNVNVLRTTATQQVIASKYEDANNYWFLEFDAAHKLHFEAKVGGVEKIDIQGTTALSSTTTKYHIQVQCDRSSGANTKIYYNGTDDTSGTPTVSTDDIDNAGALYVGQLGDGTLYFNGRVAMLGIGKPADASAAAVTASLAVVAGTAGLGDYYGEIPAGDKTALAFSSFWDMTEASGNRVDTASGSSLTLVEALGTWTSGDYTDPRDGTVYTTAVIGGQTWMTKNLAYLPSVHNNADFASEGTAGRPAYGVYGYDGSDVPTAKALANYTSYGALYNWRAAIISAPTGWHVPTHDEWTTLERAVCTSGTCVTDFPYDSTTTSWRGTNEGTTLKTGSFAGLLAGGRRTDGSFSDVGAYGYFWSSVQSGANAWSRSLFSGYATVGRNAYSQLFGFSVRCLKNPIPSTSDADIFGSWTETTAGVGSDNIETALPDAGTFSLRLASPGTSASARATQSVLTVGNSYAYSARLKLSKATTGASIYLGSTPLAITGTTSWATYTGSGTCAGDAVVHVRMDTTDAVGFFDTVSIKSNALLATNGPAWNIDTVNLFNDSADGSGNAFTWHAAYSALTDYAISGKVQHTYGGVLSWYNALAANGPATAVVEPGSNPAVWEEVFTEDSFRANGQTVTLNVNVPKCRQLDTETSAGNFVATGTRDVYANVVAGTQTILGAIAPAAGAALTIYGNATATIAGPAVRVDSATASVVIKGGATAGSVDGAHGVLHAATTTASVVMVEGAILGGSHVNADGVSITSSGKLVAKGDVTQATGAGIRNTNGLGIVELAGDGPQVYNNEAVIGDLLLTGDDVTFASNVECEDYSVVNAAKVDHDGYDLEVNGDLTIDNGATDEWTMGGGDVICWGSVDWTAALGICDMGGGTLTMKTAGKSLNAPYNASPSRVLGPVVFDANTTIVSARCSTASVSAGVTLTFTGPLTTTSNFTGGAGTRYSGAQTVTVGGNFALNGTQASPIYWDGPDLVVTGTALAYWTWAKDSDASGGKPIQVYRCVDGSGNKGWWFETISTEQSTIAHALAAGTLLGEVAADAGNSTTQFKSNITGETANFIRYAWVLFYDGALQYEAQPVATYDGTTGIFTVASAFTATPAAGTKFILLGRS